MRNNDNIFRRNPLAMGLLKGGLGMMSNASSYNPSVSGNAMLSGLNTGLNTYQQLVQEIALEDTARDERKRKEEMDQWQMLQANKKVLKTPEGFVEYNTTTGEATPIRDNRGETLFPQKTNTTVNVGKGEEAFSKTIGQKQAQNVMKAIEEGNNAYSNMKSLEIIEDGLKKGAYVGKGSGSWAAINEIAGAFGFQAGLDSSSNYRAMEQQLAKLAIQATKDLKGAISEKELDLAKSSILKMGQSAEAMDKGMAQLKYLYNLKGRVGDLAQRLLDEGRGKEFGKESRLFIKEQEPFTYLPPSVQQPQADRLLQQFNPNLQQTPVNWRDQQQQQPQIKILNIRDR